MNRLWRIAAASLVFTYLFFFEYLPPVRRVHIPYDLEGFHYPLTDYAFQNLKQGRFPQWDASNYSGMSFAGNVQAALFYPPTWLVFAANAGRDRLSYISLQDFMIAHIWLAFLLCYLWLRGRGLHELASILGAGVFAYSGYACLQLQHLGLIAGYAWFPLGLWGVDQAAERRSWLPLWKVTLASAMCFLAGYPPTWLVFAVSMTAYAAGSYLVSGPWRWRAAPFTAGALLASLAVVMVQILPAWEVLRDAAPGPRYGQGIKYPSLFLSYLLPNYFNFGMDVPVNSDFHKEYLYLGAPAVLGLAFLLRGRGFRAVIAPLGLGFACLILLTNPFGIVWDVIQHSDLLASLCRDWYFLAGISVALTALAAHGLDWFLRREAPRTSVWMGVAAAEALIAWAAWDLVRWRLNGSWLPSGWRSIYDAFAAIVVVAFALYALRTQTGRMRAALAATLLLAVGADYKTFGTSRRINAAPGTGPVYSAVSWPNMDSAAYREIREHPDYRILLDYSISPAELRHVGLSTPQGADPLFTARYVDLIHEVGGRFTTDREFEVDPWNERALKTFGVRYVVASKDSPHHAFLSNDPRFRRHGDPEKIYQVFEYLGAEPPYGPAGTLVDGVQERQWTPEVRTFTVHFAAENLLTLHEQFHPGWTALIDGRPAPVEHWEIAFQAVRVPAGEHTVEFRFHDRGLVWGAWIGLVSALGLGVWIWFAVQPRR